MTGVIDVVPEIHRSGSRTVVGFTTSSGGQNPLVVEFEMEGLPEPSELAATEAMTIASIALAMQQQCDLRVRVISARRPP